MPRTQKRPLSKKQQEVIDLMKHGWELASTTSMDASAWIQKGGAGKGGEAKNVNMQTLHGLLTRGLVERSTGLFASPVRYRLTEKALHAV